jgi:integrase
LQSEGFEVSKILTQRALEAAKPKQARYDLPDGIVPGLQFAIHPSGKKTCRLLARANGKQKSFPIGDLSLMTLADARAKAKGVLAAIANGQDPSETKRAAVRAASETVEAVTRIFIERYAKARNKTWQEAERLIERNILTVWGRRPIASIKRGDVIELLDSIVDRDAKIAANRVYANGKKMFGWAVERGMIEASPFDHVKAPSQEKSRDRTPNDSELALILRAAGTLGFPFGPFFQTLALTGQRRDEVARMRWSELNADLTVWTLPRERAKNDKEHEVPLSPWVQSILAALPRVTDLVFTTNGRTAVSGYSKAKIMLDAAITELNGGVAIPAWRIHDLRRGMASGMARMSVQLPTVEKILNHISGSFGGVRGVYQRHDFADEKRSALDMWARHLATIADAPPAATNIIEIAKARGQSAP